MAKKFDTDALMKNFIPSIVETPTIEIQLSQQREELSTPELIPASTSTHERKRAKEPKENRIATTFFLSEHLDRRLSAFVYQERERHGKKVNKTQIITEAIQCFLDAADRG